PLVKGVGAHVDRLAGMVNDLVGVDAQPAVQARRILGEPVNDVAPELAEITVVAILAPLTLKIAAPVDRGIGAHGEGAALAEGFARKNGHDAGAAERPIGEAESGGGRLEPLDEVRAVEGRHLPEDTAILDGIVHNAPDRMTFDGGRHPEAKRVAVDEAAPLAGDLAAHIDRDHLVPDSPVPEASAEAGVAADHGEAAAALGDQLHGPVELLLGKRGAIDVAANDH